jgi:RND superfamily putative drug exporter
MSPIKTSYNLAARMGRWSARHRKIAILGWLAFVAVTFLVGMAVGTKKLDFNDTGAGETARAQQILKRHGFTQPANEVVLVESQTLASSEPAFRAAVADVVSRISSHGTVKNVRSPYAPGNAGQLSKDGRAALVQFQIRGKSEDAQDRIDPIIAAVEQAQKQHPALRIEQFGDASAGKALDESVGKDFKRAEYLSVPVTLAILLLAFGAIVAAGIPVLLALTAVLSALGLLSFASQIFPADDAANSVILLIGLAVGVDYSLFYLRREREERAAGAGPEAALEAAAATSGRAVLVSGFTVLIAMAGMFLTGNKVFTSIAVGTMLVVAIAVAGSLTVLPALLSKLGDRVEKGRIPFLSRLRRTNGEGRMWGFVLDRVLRRPGLSVAAAGGLLVALTIPAFSLHTNNPGLAGLPQDLPVMKTYNRIQTAFPGGPIPAQVVVQAPDVHSPAVQDGIRNLRLAALATGKMRNPVTVDVSRDGGVALVSIPLVGDGTDSVSEHALATLRKQVIPATIGSVPGVTVDVTGTTAGSKDFNDLMKARAPIVFAFVLGFAFLLLLGAFRSLVIAVKAIVLNLLSVGAAYGILVAVFQWGWGESLLNFKSTHGVTSWLPLFLFVVLFGLSMDYHVFILSRVREAFDRGLSTEEAVAHGIKTTAGVVTSAALVMVGVFSIFATLSQIEMKQLGVGLAAAILIDATLVRAVLLPATMKLLGNWNWFLPRWLDWLPRIGIEGSERAPRARPVPAEG